MDRFMRLKNLASSPAKFVRFCHRQDIKSCLTLLESPVVWPCLDAVNISLTHTLSKFQCLCWKNLPSTMCLLKNAEKTWKEAPHPRYPQSHSPKMHPHCVDFIPIHPPYGDSPYSLCEEKRKGIRSPQGDSPHWNSQNMTLGFTRYHENSRSITKQILVGGIPTITCPSETYESQLGWWHSQYMAKESIHGPNHKPESLNIPLNSRFPHLKVSVQSPFCPISWWGLEARPRWNLQRGSRV